MREKQNMYMSIYIRNMHVTLIRMIGQLIYQLPTVENANEYSS